MSMNNLLSLKEDLKKNEENELEAISGSFNDDVELTEDEKARLEKLREKTQDNVMVVQETDEQGNVVQTPVTEYAKSLDDKVAVLKETTEGSEVLKTLNSGDIKKSVEQMKEEARIQAISTFRQLAVTGDEISDEDYLKINDDAIASLMKYFKLDRMNGDVVIKKLAKLTMSDICKILPEAFVNIYTTPAEIKANNYKAKERLLASIGYLSVTGPELDYLNEYIDEEHKLAAVNERLMKCQIDFAELIKDPKNMSEIIQETLEIDPIDTSFWAKYIKSPRDVHNKFAQRVVIQRRYKDAYKKVLEDYPVSEENARARDIILAEILECDNKMDVYQKVCDLELMRDLWPILTERYQSNKKTTMNYLIKEAQDAIERIRKCKQNVPFPGYKGDMKRGDQIFKAYMIAYPAMVRNYNKTLQDIKEKEGESFKSYVESIVVDGYTEDETVVIFSLMLLILMGRILKKLTSNTATKYDAIHLDAYFTIFCRMGTDIYVMTDVWLLMKDFVKYVLDTYYTADKKVMKV